MTFNNYIRTTDNNKLIDLIKIIKQNRCIGFVGAGVSSNKGYRIWNNLLYDKSENGKTPGLLEYSQVGLDKINGMTLPEIVDLCIENLGNEKYYDFLDEEFDRKPNQLSDNHLLLCKTNFLHIITTNFDPCLFDNAEGLIPNLRTYPANRLKYEDLRTLYHIHGRAFITNHEDESKKKDLFDDLVFGAKSYKSAYDSGMMIKQFIYNLLLDNYYFLFVGFGWKDEDFIKPLDTIRIAREEFFSKSLKINSLPDKKNRNVGYALIEYPTEEEKVLEDIVARKVSIATEEKEKLENRLKDFKTQETLLENMGMQVIAFDKMDDKFTGLTYLLQFLKDQSPFASVKKPTEILDASIAASITGSIL